MQVAFGYKTSNGHFFTFRRDPLEAVLEMKNGLMPYEGPSGALLLQREDRIHGIQSREIQFQGGFARYRQRIAMEVILPWLVSQGAPCGEKFREILEIPIEKRQGQERIRMLEEEATDALESWMEADGWTRHFGASLRYAGGIIWPKRYRTSAHQMIESPCQDGDIVRTCIELLTTSTQTTALCQSLASAYFALAVSTPYKPLRTEGFLVSNTHTLQLRQILQEMIMAYASDWFPKVDGKYKWLE